MLKEILNDIEGAVLAYLKDRKVSQPEVLIDQSIKPEFGEFSTNVAMRYAKELSNSPMELAEELSQFLREKNISGVDLVEFVPPGFINFHLSPKAKTGHLSHIIEADKDFGKSELHKGEKWVIEHTSPNPNKAIHLGHLRNNLVGMSLINLLKESGAEVVSDAVYNNRGISIAKNMYGYLAHMKKNPVAPTEINYWREHKDEWFQPSDKNMRPDDFVTECYVLGEKDFSENEEVESTVRQMVIDWEAKNEAVWELWEQVLQYAYDGQATTLARLGSYWDNVWYEHEHYQDGKNYVEEGLKKGVFKKLDDGAVLTDIEDKYQIPETILLKKDGTSLYITQDIALTDLKKKTFKADKLVWVVGPEQTLAFKQLFAVCEQLGIGKVEDFTHIPYGYVGLRAEDGSFKKMSSRSGTVMLADEVIDVVKETILGRFDEDERHEPEKRKELAEKLAIAAVKFAFLRSDSHLDMSFDIEKSVDVQGDSGMYVMYTFVRTQSILRRAGAAGAGPVDPPDKLGAEGEVVRNLLYFDAVVKKSVDDLSVHHVTQYLLNLSSNFNAWYAKEPILDGSEKEAYKLAVVKAASVTIKNGLSLLGIETVEEM